MHGTHLFSSIDMQNVRINSSSPKLSTVATGSSLLVAASFDADLVFL